MSLLKFSASAPEGLKRPKPTRLRVHPENEDKGKVNKDTQAKDVEISCVSPVPEPRNEPFCGGCIAS